MSDVDRLAVKMATTTVSRQERPDGAERRENQLVVSVIINYRGLTDTIQCLDSLLASTYSPHIVLVVDNGSHNADAAELRAYFGSRIVLIESPHNHGYGGGANIGIRWALERGAGYIWVLNNDTLIEPGALAHLVRGMEQQPGLGAASPEIHAPVGREAPHGVWFAGGRVDLAHGAPDHDLVSLERVPGSVKTAFLTGCAMLLRREAIESVGMFWPPLFLYWEDVDLSLRMRRAGWELAVVPAATIHHNSHGSVTSRLSERFFTRNALITAARHGSLWELGCAARLFAIRTVRAWASAALRRRPMPLAETRGLCEGLMVAVGVRLSFSRAAIVSVVRRRWPDPRTGQP